MLRIVTLSPIRGLERRSVDLAPEDCHLVAQHDDLDPEVNVTATDGPDQLQDAAHCPVEEPGADAPRPGLALPRGDRLLETSHRVEAGARRPARRYVATVTRSPIARSLKAVWAVATGSSTQPKLWGKP